ncbi:MAG: membrane integrity-associated transporter subunit PqiC [Rhodocyclaceae bacterium]|nr:membrane integrity-associated transporter subunit PqiC [Rhodocyclaceae bacterium]
MSPSTIRICLLLPAVVLAACAGGPGKEPARFDLGAGAGDWRSPGFVLRTVEVQGPSWLGTPAIQYRLAYAEGTRRQAYAESRWIAPPTELLEQALKARVAATESTRTDAGCRLRVDLDEFIQRFDTPTDSRLVVEARATLLAARGDSLLGRRAFAVAQPAPTPDARGAAAAAAAAVQAVTRDLNGGLAVLARETPVIVERCRA